MIAPGDLYFTLRSLPLGYDEDGDPVTSAVVEQSDNPNAICKRHDSRVQVARTALTDALAEHGRTDMGSACPSGVTVISLEAWQAKCRQRELTTGNGESTARMAIKRAKDRLIDLILVCGFDNYFWKVCDDA